MFKKNQNGLFFGQLTISPSRLEKKKYSHIYVKVHNFKYWGTQLLVIHYY